MNFDRCPRCGYPNPDGPWGYSRGTIASMQICAPCTEVELMETIQLGRVLPIEQWAMND